MALQHTRLISKVFQSRVSSLSSIRRHASGSSEGSSGAPYRPWPTHKYNWEESAKFWIDNGFTPASAESDDYPAEEVYLSEIEERLRKYDRKFSDADRIKALYNEFGWEAIDDRATYNYGGSLGGDQYGPGKKIDPAHYITPEWTNAMRRSVPPIQYMTAEQVRRSRGMLASTRETPPELDSIWKYWNGYACLGVFGTFMVTKEYFVTGGHDMFEAIIFWSFFGTVASFAGDWYAWWHTCLLQEFYDRQYFPLLRNVERLNTKLEAINGKPNEKQLVSQMTKYRELIAEKVLSKTLQNRLNRGVESTVAKLEAKITEEQLSKKDAETAWKRQAINQCVDYFDDGGVREEFMRNALAMFCAGETAALGNKNVSMETDVFAKKYETVYAQVKDGWMKDQRNKGTLSAVFMDANERESMKKSADDKKAEYEKKVGVWADAHNDVNVGGVPSFA